MKTTSDLLALRSDAYTVTADHRLVLAPSRGGQPPAIDLDANYKMLPEFDEAFGEGVPSLLECDSLQVVGKWRFSPGIVCKGAVKFINKGGEYRTIPAKTYVNQGLEF